MGGPDDKDFQMYRDSSRQNNIAHVPSSLHRQPNGAETETSEFQLPDERTWKLGLAFFALLALILCIIAAYIRTRNDEDDQHEGSSKKRTYS